MSLSRQLSRERFLGMPSGEVDCAIRGIWIPTETPYRSSNFWRQTRARRDDRIAQWGFS
jgi:hypothetical protein